MPCQKRKHILENGVMAKEERFVQNVPFGRFYVIKVIKSYCCKGQGEKFNISSQVQVHVKALFTLRFYPLELSLGLSIETSMCACVFQSITVHFELFAACPSSVSVG